MVTFFNSNTLADGEMVEGLPWDFSPPTDMLERLKSAPKSDRRKLVSESGRWNVYSAVRGVGRRARVSKENPPAALRGLVIDYDQPTSDQDIRLHLTRIKETNFKPNFIERSLSGNVRLVWLFEREVLLPNAQFCKKLLEAFHRKLGADNLLAGYDVKSLEPAQVWTNGVEWIRFKEAPMPWETVFGLVCSVSEGVEWGESEIPYEVLYEEVEKRWPGRWHGPFDLDKTGVRFWDPTASNSQGCRVKPDGMQCFTGLVGFQKWDQIFGEEWCNSKRAVNLGKAAGDTYFDGDDYWQMENGIWQKLSRADLFLDLKCKKIPVKPKRGHIASDAEQVLRHIQRINRVVGAAPIVNRRPGITILHGLRVLNTSRIKALEPADMVGVTPAEFPFVWFCLDGLFVDEVSLVHWLAWMKRFYVAVLEYRPLMGQAVFLCGPKNNGKTLLAVRIIQPLIGDKAANPYPYFTGQTPFNAELFESPLLMINDEESITQTQIKLKFLARMKSFTVNPTHMYHKKFGTPFAIEWTGRMFCTLNDDNSSVGVLPEVNENTADKLMFFKTQPRLIEWPDNEWIEKTIQAELPFFARFLLEWEPPKEVVMGGRMGVRSYQDPDLLRTSEQQHAHYRLLEVLRLWFEHGGYWSPEEKPQRDVWEGDPTRLYTEMASVETLKDATREWNSEKCFRALDTLSRNDNSGVVRVTGDERLFSITRSIVMKTKLTEDKHEIL